MRFIGVGVITGYLYSVAIHGDTVAVCQYTGTNIVILFDYCTGERIGQFGEVGGTEGQLGYCTGICFTGAGTQLLIGESNNNRVSLFSVDGVFMKCIGVGMLRGGYMDVECVGDHVIVADCCNHRVCIFSLSSGKVVRTFGSYGKGNGEFMYPSALAVVNNHLYVLNMSSACVQVFE